MKKQAFFSEARFSTRVRGNGGGSDAKQTDRQRLRERADGDASIKAAADAAQSGRPACQRRAARRARKALAAAAYAASAAAGSGPGSLSGAFAPAATACARAPVPRREPLTVLVPQPKKRPSLGAPPCAHIAALDSCTNPAVQPAARFLERRSWRACR